MTPQELIAEIRDFEEYRRELASTLSEAFEASAEDDMDSLLLDEAGGIISGLAGSVEAARQKVLTYLGARTLAEENARA